MKTDISILLLDALAKPGKATCFLIKIKSKLAGGTAYGFTTLDAAIRFNDGKDDIVYRAYNVLQPQNIQSTWNISEADNTELHGWFGDIVAQLITAGLFGDAEITMYRVAYNHMEYGAEIVGFGTVGKAEFSASKQGSRKVEFRGLSDALMRKVNPVYSITCRNEFGDERCGMPFVWEPGTISEVYNNLMAFKVTGISRPLGYYDFGVVLFKDGSNANVQMEVETWAADGAVKLSFLTPYPIVSGTEVWFRWDCNKFDATCIDTYNNIVNFNGEHLTPVQDQSLMVPGAYIKSSNAL